MRATAASAPQAAPPAVPAAAPAAPPAGTFAIGGPSDHDPHHALLGAGGPNDPDPAHRQARQADEQRYLEQTSTPWDRAVYVTRQPGPSQLHTTVMGLQWVPAGEDAGLNAA